MKNPIWWISSPHSSQRRNGPSAPLFFAEFWKDDTSKKGGPLFWCSNYLWFYGFISSFCWCSRHGRGSKLGARDRNHRSSLVLARLFGSYNNLDPFPCYVWMFPYLEKNVDSCLLHAMAMKPSWFQWVNGTNKLPGREQLIYLSFA